MHITAIFEEWLLGDGVYPLLDRGQQIKVAFELQQDALTEAGPGAIAYLTHKGGGAYDFSGHVLWAVDDEAGPAVIAIETAGFRFYCESHQRGRFQAGTQLAGSGFLCLDNGLWSERMAPRPDVPDLFKPLTITRIQKVTIPESFINRSGNGMSHPAYLAPWEYSATELGAIETMDGHACSGVFFLLECDSAGLEDAQIPLTFIE